MVDQRILQVFRKAGVRWQVFILPSLFSVAAGLAEAVNIAILLPLCRGLVAGNYDFLKTQSWFLRVGGFLHLDRLSNTLIFALLLATVFISAAGKSICEYFSILIVSKEIRLFSNNLRKLLFGRFITFGKLFFDQSSLGVIYQHLIATTQRISYDLKSYQLALTVLCQLVVYLGTMFAICWQLTLAAFFMFPLLHFASSWLVHKIRISSSEHAAAADELAQKIFNVFSAMLLVKSYHAEELEKKSFARVSDSVERLEFSIDKKDGLIMPLQEFVFLVVMLLLVGVVAVLVRYHVVSDFSKFLVFFYILKRSSSHFKTLNSIRTSYAVSIGQWQNVLGVLEDDGKHFVKSGPKEFRGLSRSIEVKGLSFSYPSRPGALKDCSFVVEKGKMTALVGETGSGKSTVVNLLCRFYEAPKGTVLIDGVDINEFSLGSFYRHVAYVSQDIQLMNDSFRANLLYGLDAASIPEEKILLTLERARLSDYVKRLEAGLDTPLKERGRRQNDATAKVGDRGVRLSGGEKQRLSLARAMLKEADILVLDEATSALDSATERLIQDSIMEAARGRTSFVIAHRLSTIKHADKIIVFHDGRVVEEGKLQDLLEKKGRFYELWEAQKF